MRVIGTGSVFAEELLAQLPIGYRFMVQVEAASFGENQVGQRFSTSARHQSRSYQCSGPGKPVSSLVVQEYLTEHRDEY